MFASQAGLVWMALLFVAKATDDVTRKQAEQLTQMMTRGPSPTYTTDCVASKN